MVKQIAVSKNSKRIIETVNSLRAASLDNAEKIHALSETNGKQVNDRRVYSRIKIRIINIEPIENIQLEFNLTPDEILWLQYRARLGIVHRQDYSDMFKRAWPGKDGEYIEPSITIRYTRFANKQKTQIMNYPFNVEIKHIKYHESASHMKEAVNEKKVGMLLSEQAFFNLLNDTVRFIEVWEQAYGCDLIEKRRSKTESLAASNVLNVRLKQIYVRKTSDSIFECLDSLKPAAIEYAENIYSGEKYYADAKLLENEQPKNLTRDYSRITVKIRNLCEKTADGKQVTAGFALSVPDINYIWLSAEMSLLFKQEFTHSCFRKWNAKSGLVTHTMFYIQYQRFRDKLNLDEYEYPYYVNIINRTGKGDWSGNKIVKVENETNLSVRLSPFEFFSFLADCKRYMRVFEALYGQKGILAKAAMEKQLHEDYFNKPLWDYYNVV